MAYRFSGMNPGVNGEKMEDMDDIVGDDCGIDGSALPMSGNTARRVLWQRGHETMLPSTVRNIIQNATVKTMSEALHPLCENRGIRCVPRRRNTHTLHVYSGIASKITSAKQKHVRIATQLFAPCGWIISFHIECRSIHKLEGKTNSIGRWHKLSASPLRQWHSQLVGTLRCVPICGYPWLWRR